MKPLPWLSDRLTPAIRCSRASVVDSEPVRAKSEEVSLSTVTGSLSGSMLAPGRGVGATTTTSETEAVWADAGVQITAAKRPAANPRVRADANILRHRPRLGT